MTTVRRRTRKIDMEELKLLFAQQRDAKRAAAIETALANSLRDRITPIIERAGVAHGDKGQHLAIELPEPIDGCTRLVRRANSSTFINVDRAENLATRGKYLEEIQSGSLSLTFEGTPAEVRKVKAVLRKMGALDVEGTVVNESQTFSQARLMAYHQRHPDVLTEKLLDGLYDTTTTHSFNPE